MIRISGKIRIENGNVWVESTVFQKRLSITNLGKISPDNAFCFIKIRKKPGEPGLELAHNNDEIIGNAEDSKITITKVR